jgi:hypothetical protein
MVKNWRAPADRGQPDPEKMAIYIMLVILAVLFMAYVRVGIREGWFEPIIEFILS